jgi:hypothetical protein
VIENTAPSKSEADEAQDLGAETGAMAERGGDVAGTGHAEQRDGQVAQRSHDLGAHPLADLGAVFIKSDIANPVEAVFDRPVAPAQAEQASRSCLLGREAGNPKDRFDVGFLADDMSGVALEAEDLGAMGKLEIASQFGAGPDLADFQPSMGFIGGSMLRGEKISGPDPQYLAGGWADYL